ncbi:hypothetical protein FRC06_003914 [Ceratobasidium sp. 370]|nr:hypothetical protein FRC06_003914 [Ceratobasidium sp. 370]
MHDAWLTLASQIGEAEFQKLDADSQPEVERFLAWALGVVKGGVAQMAGAWEDLGLTPPITLKNKFEAAQSSYGQLKN